MPRAVDLALRLWKVIPLILVLLVLTAPSLLLSAVTHAAGADQMRRDAPRVESYLRRLIGDSRIRIVVKDNTLANVMLAEKMIGKLELHGVGDGEDDFIATLGIPGDVAPVGERDIAKIERYLRGLFGRQNIRLAVNKPDDVAFYVGPDSVGSLSTENGVTGVSIVILSDLLPAARFISPSMGEIKPVDSSNSTYFIRTASAEVYESATAGPVVATLSEDQRVKVTGRTDGGDADERWYQIDYADGKPRFVLGKDLLSEKSRELKKKYKGLETTYAAILGQIGGSQGKLSKFMGFYTLGQDCRLSPMVVDAAKGFASTKADSQRVQDMFWATTSGVLWTDGGHVFRAFVETGAIMKYKPSFMRERTYDGVGKVQLYRLERVDPPGMDPDLAITGFAENGKLLVNVQIDGGRIKHRTATRCNSLQNVRDAVVKYYRNAIDRLSVE